ncbi:uncharacterized protein TRUGW13939_02635 [Talaromyces rugulosus]|uniref:Uncharacterized protein n=1 Tax=Talaromyces rugulosus TaxID=121627 RepID=A0A7H8QPY8_TALRU|nr:uncharacterized protein TRUGW13939_02635 [Talaromyces rugulosus]QKX55541.1 hypothetical protein TRUGW13939_02635 [Talaromyces rugulosus]
MGLLDLPNKLLYAISKEVKNLHYCDALSTLYAFTLTHSVLWRLFEPVLYQFDMETYKGRALKWGVDNDAVETVEKSLGTRTWTPGHPMLSELLMKAAKWGFVAIVKLLLDHNADINHYIVPPSSFHLYELRNPMLCAVEEGKTDVVELLLEYDKQAVKFRDPVGIPGRIPAHINSPLFLAVRRIHVDIVKLLVHKGALAVGRRETSDPLVYAVLEGNLELLAALLGEVHPQDRAYKHRQDISFPAEHLANLLKKAISGDDVEVVGLLLKHGADFNKMKLTSDEDYYDGFNYGHYYGEKKFERLSRHMLEYLLNNGLPLDTRKAWGTALWHNVVEKRELLHLLLAHPQGPNTFRKKYPVLLERAIWRHNKDDTEFLLQQGKEWRTPADLFPGLYSAIYSGYYGSAARLLSCGAPANVPPGFTFLSQEHSRYRRHIIRPLLWIATKGDNLRLVKCLLEHGADPNKIAFPNHLKSAKNALQLAIDRKNTDIAELLCDYGAVAANTTSHDRSYTMRVVQRGNLKLAERYLS